MKKKFLILILLALVIIAASISFVISLQIDNPIRRQQETLAKELSVKIDDYPYRASFPIGYFYIALQPGMNVQEVHSIIRGYKKAYRCKSSGVNFYYSEIYYYFSLEDLKALRFIIFYNEEGGFKRLESEDDDSRTIRIGSDCELGVIMNSTGLK
jgi:hypothetical protein